MNDAELAQARFQALCLEAFEQDRFVLMLLDRQWQVLAQFTPTYDELELFAQTYIVPFAVGLGGVFQHNTWRAPFAASMESTKRHVHMSRYLRWSDVACVEILTETEEQRMRIDVKIGEMIRPGPP
jgi:hypothetical protein